MLEITNSPRKMYALKVEYFNKIPIFDSLKPDELKILIKYMNCIGFHEGDIIVKEGEKGNYVFFILEGQLEVIKEANENQYATINVIGKGRSIGEMSMIDETPRSATLRAKTDLVLLRLTKDGFNTIMQEHHEMGIKILKGMARLLSMNLRKTSSRLADYMTPMC